MKEIKTVALVGLGAIGAYFADRLQPVLGDDLRVIAGGARAARRRSSFHRSTAWRARRLWR